MEKIGRLFNFNLTNNSVSIEKNVSRDMRDRYFIESVDSFIKLSMALGEPYTVIQILRDILHGKYGMVATKHKMQLHVRVAICAITVHFDHECALYHIKRARALVNRQLPPFELMLFYCVYGWAHINTKINEGSVSKGIMSFNYVERVAPTDAVSVKILARARKCLAIICRITDDSLVDAIDKVVTLDDIADHADLLHTYDCINLGFKMSNNEKQRRRSWFNTCRYKLFVDMVDLYSCITSPLAGPYERGNPATITKCVNEFLSIYTDESTKYQATEKDIIELEEKYDIHFDRKTLKFTWK